MSTGGQDVHTLVGAYAMDAVSDAERERFRQHLADCGDCREEVRGLREATARLASAAAVIPRPELKATAMLAAAHTRQLPPVTSPVPAAPDTAVTPAADSAAAAGLGAGRTRSRPARGHRSAHGFPRARWARAALSAAAAVVLIAAVTITAMLAGGARQRLNVAQGNTMAVTRVLSAADAQTMRGRVVTGGTATVVMSHREGKAVFTADGLKVLAPHRRYELWVMSSAGDRPAGMITTDRGGMVTPMLVSGISPADQIGMTVEPAAGAAQPTLPAVLQISLHAGG